MDSFEGRTEKANTNAGELIKHLKTGGTIDPSLREELLKLLQTETSPSGSSEDARPVEDTRQEIHEDVLRENVKRGVEQWVAENSPGRVGDNYDKYGVDRRDPRVEDLVVEYILDHIEGSEPEYLVQVFEFFLDLNSKDREQGFNKLSYRGVVHQKLRLALANWLLKFEVKTEEDYRIFRRLFIADMIIGKTLEKLKLDQMPEKSEKERKKRIKLMRELLLHQVEKVQEILEGLE